jgi:hypothetical protein
VVAEQAKLVFLVSILHHLLMAEEEMEYKFL